MPHPFVSTRPRLAGQPAVLLLSITTHLVLVYAAFAPRPAISIAAGDIARTRPAIEQIRYVAMASQRAAPKEIARERMIDEAPVRPIALRLEAPRIDPIELTSAAPSIPDIDFSAAVTRMDSSVKPAAIVTDVTKGLLVDPAKLAAHVGPYAKEDVDKVVRPYRNNPKPIYPWRLQRMGVEESFVAQFVVDSTGRVDERTVLIPPDANSLLVKSVLDALRRSRYHAAEVGGRRVMQLVEQRFTFILVSGRGEYR